MAPGTSWSSLPCAPRSLRAPTARRTSRVRVEANSTMCKGTGTPQTGANAPPHAQREQRLLTVGRLLAERIL